MSEGRRPVGRGDRYPQLLTAPGLSRRRSVIGLLVMPTVAFLAAFGVLVVMTLLAHAAVGGEQRDDILGVDRPLGLLANNLMLAMLVPAALLTVLAVHHEKVGWLASVIGKPRWMLLGRFFALALVVVLGFFVAGYLLPADLDATDADDPVSSATLAGLLVVILLSTPLQAAAEEVGFRGYLSQGIASLVRRPVVGAVAAAVVSAVLFALAHGVQDAWLFADRLAFGLVASWVVWRTGGLEAAVALHVANNVVALVAAALTGSMEASLTASTLPWEYALLDIAMMLSFAALADRLARRWRVATHRPALVCPLVPSSAVGYPGSSTSTPLPAGNERPWGMG